MTEASLQPTKPSRGILPAVGLFFLSPLVAEFLLGNLPIKLLPALIVLAPLYGGGALLIREVARRARLGWPGILVLGLAYGVLEEAFTTQTLFNPDYLSMHMHLLEPAYIHALGIGGWWTVFVLTLHTAWSVATPIAFIEALLPGQAETPWLGRIGLAVTSALFAAGVAATTIMGYKRDHYLATPAQFGCAALVCVVLVLLAFRLPRRTGATSTGWVPNPWLAGAGALVAASIVLTTPRAWGWWAVAAILAIEIAVTAAVLFWSRRTGWDMRHQLALASGAALTYAWHSFVETPVIPGSVLGARIGNAIFTMGALILIATAAMGLSPRQSASETIAEQRKLAGE